MSSAKSGRQVITPTRMRRAVARLMTASKQQAPHFYVSSEIDMGSSQRLIDTLNEGKAAEERVTLTALMVKAVAKTLAQEPGFNAHWTDAGHELIEAINIGVAIDLPDGLLAPAILECRELDLMTISARLRDLVARAQAGKLRATEINDATFTLSNLGMFDVSSFTAIITPPQVAILATGRSEPRARVANGEIVARSMMTATLSVDHRAIDGAGAARFLGKLKHFLESSDSWIR